jgi:hypothetical protein
MAAIRSGPLGRIAVTYVEWAGSDQQAVTVPWTVLSDPNSIEDFARRLESAPASIPGPRTAISSAVLFAADLFSSSETRSNRRTIDVSGDGAGDQGLPIASVRDLVVARHITINGLSMNLADPDANGPYAAMFDDGAIDIHAYYREHVVGGPGAFAIAVDDIDDFAPAILRKLIIEIALRPISPSQLGHRPVDPEESTGNSS